VRQLVKKVNPLNHILVPSHQILTKEEAEKVLKKHNISPLQLPDIFTNDPIVKALKANPGDIIKIIRNDPTNSYEYFRRVTEWTQNL
jgi:DNA-directed RNA polymerase subunit H